MYQGRAPHTCLEGTATGVDPSGSVVRAQRKGRPERTVQY